MHTLDPPDTNSEKFPATRVEIGHHYHRYSRHHHHHGQLVITKFFLFSATRVAMCSVAVPQVTSTVARGGTKCFNRRWRGELVTLDLDKVLNKS